MLTNIKNNLKKNKYLYILLLITFVSLVYCSLNTLIVNDDLGYSFFYRTSTRITNIIEVIKMQISDYKIVSSRVFIHTIVQALLIFGKSLWSFLNPIIIILNFYFINKIIKIYVKDNNIFFNFVLGLCCFFLMVSYKWLIYWVSGSINYVWLSTLLFSFIYLYLNNDFCSKTIINMIFILIISILHESTFVFSVIFIIFNIIYDLIKYKKIFISKLLLFIPIILSGIFLFLGPGMISRINANEIWSTLTLIEKFKLSLPVVSFNIYNLKNLNNLIPIFFIILTLFKLFKYKDNKKFILIIPILIAIILIIFINNNWLYFILTTIIIFSNFYINFKDGRDKLSILMTSFYAISYSLCLTVEYVSGRPNYFIFIYMIFLIILYSYDLFDKKILNKSLYMLIPMLCLLIGKEIYVYTQIGNVKKERLIAIQNYKQNKIDKLYYKKIDEKYSWYQMDLNEPLNKDYYAYKYFLDYYNLPSDTQIEYID